ncbi:transposase [Streptomyces sp. NPDC050416]|uniref:IS110 family transposase n=1 Tax=Streptomyces sp. NPDC050416 TaxID=3365611 RepID=UPI0037B10B7A
MGLSTVVAGWCHTHGEVHVAAVLCPLGQVLGTKSFPATAAGSHRLLGWARKLGTVRRAGVEGTGTFGAGLSRYLLARHVQVYEVNRPDRTARRLLGKSDPLGAQAAARAAQRSRPGPGQNWRRSGAKRPDVQTRPRLRG